MPGESRRLFRKLVVSAERELDPFCLHSSQAREYDDAALASGTTVKQTNKETKQELRAALMIHKRVLISNTIFY